MKYEPDKLTKVLARISIVSVALFGTVIFYFLFRARLGMQIYPESFAWIKLFLGMSTVLVTIWLAITLFDSNDD